MQRRRARPSPCLPAHTLSVWSPDSANTVHDNRVHANQRAGIAVQGQHNRLERNDASGNGLKNIAPTCRFDLMDFSGIDNVWIDNAGTTGPPLARYDPFTLACP